MNWSEEQLAERNRAVFGETHGPARDGVISVESRSALKAGGVSQSEAQIEAECTKILEEDGWRALRTDPVSDRGRGKGFGEVGMADHLYIRYDFVRQNDALRRLEGAGVMECYSENLTQLHAYCDVMWIEFKSANGKPKKHQIEWHMKERARGALALIAGVDFTASVEGFVKWYAASGLKRVTEVRG